MSDRVALLIGSGRFPDEPRLAALAGPQNDVPYLAAVLENAEIGAFQVRKFVDVEHYKLLPILESTLRNAQRDDLILLYYSGHGKLDFRGQLCLATVNTKLDALLSTSLPLPHIKSLIDNSRSNRIILVLDCCFSGAAAKAFVRGGVDDQLGIAQEEGGAGVHILTSATEIQSSHEREREEGGVVLGEFTRCIVEGIKSGEADLDIDEKITVTDLQRYLHGRVRGQKPRYWGLEASGDLVIARSPVLKPAELPPELRQSIEDHRSWVREGAVRELDRLLRCSHKGLALAARIALERLSDEDDSLRVRTAAAEIVLAYSAAEVGGGGAPVLDREKEPAPAPEPAPPEAKPPAEPPRPARPPVPFGHSSVRKALPWFIAIVGFVGVLVAFWVFQEPKPLPRVETPPSPPPRPVPEKEIPKPIVEAPTPPKMTPGEPTKTTATPKGMVLIPAGEFWMGCNEKVDKNCESDEKPGGKVYLNAFSIDKQEVTVADYRICVEAGKCSSKELTGQGLRHGFCNWDERGREDHPINCVGWSQAKAYCAWAGKRLPTEAEWEKAARGTDGRIYPWGNQWDSSRANVGSSSTNSVGSYASGVSPYGVYDMVGNAFEWTSSLYKFYPYKAQDGREDPNASGDRVRRGQAWKFTDVARARASFRGMDAPGDRADFIGFRCAKTP